MARLTKRDVEAAKLPERKDGEPLKEYRKRWGWLGDGEVTGFGVKVYGSGRKVFAIRYRTRGGRSRMVTLGGFGELTVDRARDLAREEKVRVRQGEDPQAERQREHVAIGTVSKLVTEWLEQYAKAHRRRWKEDEYRLNKHIIPKLGKVRLEDLTGDVLATWHRRIGKEKPVEANRSLETLRAAWRWADREGLLAAGLHDPTKRVKRFRERSRDRWLRMDELTRLMDVVREHEDAYVRAAIPLLLLTGLRKNELLKARWTDLDMERGEIRLQETKSGESQIRLLPTPAQDILRNLPRVNLRRNDPSPWIFPSPTDPSKPRDDLKKPWMRIREKAGLEGVTLHDLRRTAGSYMAQAGIPLQVIQEVLGQSHPGVTRIYARLASENERKALDTLAEVLSGPLGLGGGSREPETLPAKLRALLDEVGDDSSALAGRLRGLVDWSQAVDA
jgi:integrase